MARKTPGPRRFQVYGFASTHDALAAEIALRKAGIEHRTIPPPGSAGSLCGIAVRVPEGLEAAAEQAFRDSDVRWETRVDHVEA